MSRRIAISPLEPVHYNDWSTFATLPDSCLQLILTVSLNPNHNPKRYTQLYFTTKCDRKNRIETGLNYKLN